MRLRGSLLIVITLMALCGRGGVGGVGGVGGGSEGAQPVLALKGLVFAERQLDRCGYNNKNQNAAFFGPTAPSPSAGPVHAKGLTRRAMSRKYDCASAIVLVPKPL